MNKFAAAMCLAVSMLASTAHAGVHSVNTVYVGASEARGAFRAARYSANKSEFILCTLSAGRNAVGSTTTWAWFGCSAKDARGRTYTCTAVNPPQAAVDIVAGMNRASFVHFWGDAAGQCLGVENDQSSAHL